MEVGQHILAFHTILYGPGSLEEAHSVDEKIKAKELAQYSDVLYTF